MGAMQHGKLLVIRMGTAAPDFKSTFNDALIAKGLIKQYSKEDPAVKVLEEDRRKGLLRSSREAHAAQSNSGEGDEDKGQGEKDGEDEDEWASTRRSEDTLQQQQKRPTKWKHPPPPSARLTFPGR